MEKQINRADQLQFLRFLSFLMIFLWHANTYAFSFFPGGNGATHSFSAIIPSIRQLLMNLLLIQSWFPTGYFSFNGVGWFLSTIMFLYILNIPLRAHATNIKKKKKSEIIFAAIFLISFIITWVYCYALRNTNMEYTQYVLPASRIGEYICGMALGYLVFPINKALKNNKYITIAFSILEILSLFLWVYGMYIPIDAWQFRICHWMIPNCVILITFGFGRGIISSLFRLNYLRYLGDISFECFLLHQIIIYEYSITSGVRVSGNLGNAFSIMFCLVITVLIATFISNSSIAPDNSKKYNH